LVKIRTPSLKKDEKMKKWTPHQLQVSIETSSHLFGPRFLKEEKKEIKDS
jgi:hypothetical protein